MAQKTNDQQLWLEFTLNHTFQNGLLYTSEINYSRILKNNEIWSRYHLNQIFTYNIIAPLDLAGGIFSSVEIPVKNTDLYNIIEVRPWIGTRIHFNPGKRFLARAYIRFEERFIFYLSEFPNAQKSRLRIRPEFIYPLNKSTIFQDKAFWLRLDGEYFFNISDPPEERYAKTANIRLGMGYRLNYGWRFGGYFNQQFSRNSIEDNFQGNSQIIYLIVNYFFKPKVNKDSEL
jgi:hypothetical protein